MASPNNRLPHLGVLAAGRELAAYAEVSPERARQLTLMTWWTVEPLDYVGGRFVYSYPAAVRLLTQHGYPKRLHPNMTPVRRGRTGARAVPVVPVRQHIGVLAGVGEIARAANVPTSRASQMTKETWWDVRPLDHLAGGTLYSYPEVVRCLTQNNYPRVHKTIGERLEAETNRP